MWVAPPVDILLPFDPKKKRQNTYYILDSSSLVSIYLNQPQFSCSRFKNKKYNSNKKK